MGEKLRKATHWSREGLEDKATGRVGKHDLSSTVKGWFSVALKAWCDYKKKRVIEICRWNRSYASTDHVSVRFDASKINVFHGKAKFRKSFGFPLKGFGAIMRCFFFFLVISKLVYFANLRWKRFSASHESHGQRKRQEVVGGWWFELHFSYKGNAANTKLCFFDNSRMWTKFFAHLQWNAAMERDTERKDWCEASKPTSVSV